MIVAPPGRQLSKTLSSLVSDITDNFINSAINDLAEQAKLVLAREGVNTSHLKQSPSLDVCYRGQSFTLNIPWNGLAEVEKSFHEQHEKRFGHRLDMPVEIINVRLGITAEVQPIEISAISNPTHHSDAQASVQGRVFGHDQPVDIWQRDQLAVEQHITGPAVIMDDTSTTYVANNWQCKLDRIGNLLLESLKM
jgi:N-methylhydantoinase A